MHLKFNLNVSQDTEISFPLQNVHKIGWWYGTNESIYVEYEIDVTLSHINMKMFVAK